MVVIFINSQKEKDQIIALLEEKLKLADQEVKQLSRKARQAEEEIKRVQQCCTKVSGRAGNTGGMPTCCKPCTVCMHMYLCTMYMYYILCTLSVLSVF